MIPAVAVALAVAALGVVGFAVVKGREPSEPSEAPKKKKVLIDWSKTSRADWEAAIAKLNKAKRRKARAKKKKAKKKREIGAA